jgi:polyisoprenoid-binding protein YceI
MPTVTVPAGTWTVDPVHSSIGFAVDHMGTSTFRCTFEDVDALLRDGVLEGTARVDSIAIALEDFKRHVLASDFFDAERSPTLEFRSTVIDVADDGALSVEGELTIKGTARPVTATGTLAGPLEGMNGRPRIGIELETTVDRFDYGLNWDVKMPDGRSALGQDVTIQIAVELVER